MTIQVLVLTAREVMEFVVTAELTTHLFVTVLVASTQHQIVSFDHHIITVRGFSQGTLQVYIYISSINFSLPFGSVFGPWYPTIQSFISIIFESLQAISWSFPWHTLWSGSSFRATPNIFSLTEIQWSTSNAKISLSCVRQLKNASPYKYLHIM